VIGTVVVVVVDADIGCRDDECTVVLDN